jgi:hypothetical protein
MPGDPKECRRNAKRCLRLAERAQHSKARENLIAFAEMWRKLAAELESHEALLSALSEMKLEKATNAMPPVSKDRS